MSALGREPSTAADENLLSEPDEVIAAAAKKEARMLLTLDLDLVDARKYPPGSHPGIVLFRPRQFGPLAVNAFVLDFVAQSNLTDFAGCLTVVETDRVRIRKPE